MMRVLILVLLLGLVLSGCETFKGFGRDMQKAGGWIEEKAEKAD